MVEMDVSLCKDGNKGLNNEMKHKSALVSTTSDSDHKDYHTNLHQAHVRVENARSVDNWGQVWVGTEHPLEKPFNSQHSLTVVQTLFLLNLF